MAALTYRQLAVSYLRAAAKAKTPVTQAVRYLREQKISFRYQEMLTTYRAYAKVGEVVDRYKYIPKIYRIPKRQFAEPPDFMKRRYLYEVEYNLKNRVTGEVFTKTNKISSDYWLTSSRAEGISFNAVGDKFSEYLWDVEDYNIVASFHRLGDEW